MKIQFFNNPTLGKVSLSKVVSIIADFVNKEPERKYTIAIGTDSHSEIKKTKEIDFVTAIVIHREGKGGRYFWKKTKDRKIYSLRDKIYKETMISLQVAEDFVPKLRRTLYRNQYKLEIHLDVGSVGETKELIKEVVGIVHGNGFTAKTKPESYGAFIVADKYT